MSCTLSHGSGQVRMEQVPQCHGVCGTGKQFMFRDIAAGPTGAGAPCEVGEQFMERDCDLGHPCTNPEDCPYGPNGKQCSGPDHGKCTLQSGGTEACECKSPWLGQAREVTCAISTRTDTVCDIGKDAEYIRQTNLQYVTPQQDALVVQGWQRVAEQPNACNNITGRCECHVQHWGAHAGYTGPACDHVCPPGLSGELCSLAMPELASLATKLKHFEPADFVAWSSASDVVPLYSIYNFPTHPNGANIAYAGGYNVHGFRMERVDIDMTKLADTLGDKILNCFATDPGPDCIITHTGLSSLLSLSPAAPLKLSALTWFPLRHVELPDAGLTWTAGSDAGTMYVGYHMMWVPNSQEEVVPTSFPSGLEYTTFSGTGSGVKGRNWDSWYVLAVVWHDTGAGAASNHALAQRLWITSGDSASVVLEHAVTGHRLRPFTPNTWTVPLPADSSPGFFSISGTHTATAATHLSCWGTPNQQLPVAWSDAIQCVLNGINEELATP